MSGGLSILQSIRRAHRNSHYAPSAMKRYSCTRKVFSSPQSPVRAVPGFHSPPSLLTCPKSPFPLLSLYYFLYGAPLICIDAGQFPPGYRTPTNCLYPSQVMGQKYGILVYLAEPRAQFERSLVRTSDMPKTKMLSFLLGSNPGHYTTTKSASRLLPCTPAPFSFSASTLLQLRKGQTMQGG